MRHALSIVPVLLTLLLAGCGIGPAEPALVDPASLADYIHPAGTVSIKLPPDWILSDRSTDTAQWVDFFAPGEPEAAVRVFAMPAASLPAGAEGAIMAYQPLFNDRVDATYKTLSQTAQADGSLRLQVVADTIGGPVQYNDFVHVGGDTVAVLRVRLTESASTPHTLGLIADSFALMGGASAAAGEAVTLGLTGVTAWAHADGVYEIAGQVVNESAVPVERPLVTVELTDAGNAALSATTAGSPALSLLPGEVAPFSVIFSPESAAGAVGYTLAASGTAYDAAAAAYCPADALAVTADSGSDAEGVLVISGRVTNAGAVNASGIVVAITLFDSAGGVIGMGTFSPGGPLAPGQESTFTLRFPDPGGAPVNFLYAAWGTCQQ